MPLGAAAGSKRASAAPPEYGSITVPLGVFDHCYMAKGSCRRYYIADCAQLASRAAISGARLAASTKCDVKGENARNSKRARAAQSVAWAVGTRSEAQESAVLQGGGRRIALRSGCAHRPVMQPCSSARAR